MTLVRISFLELKSIFTLVSPCTVNESSHRVVRVLSLRIRCRRLNSAVVK